MRPPVHDPLSPTTPTTPAASTLAQELLAQRPAPTPWRQQLREAIPAIFMFSLFASVVGLVLWAAFADLRATEERRDRFHATVDAQIQAIGLLALDPATRQLPDAQFAQHAQALASAVPDPDGMTLIEHVVRDQDGAWRIEWTAAMLTGKECQAFSEVLMIWSPERFERNQEVLARQRAGNPRNVDRVYCGYGTPARPVTFALRLHDVLPEAQRLHPRWSSQSTF